MKLTTPIIAILILALAVFIWLGISAQKADAPEMLPVNTESQNEVEAEETNSDPVYEDEEDEPDFGNDAGMEFPIPDDDELLEVI